MSHVAICDIGDVVFLSVEDDCADTIVPRLNAAGADCSRIYIIDEVEVSGSDGSTEMDLFNLAADIYALEDMLIKNTRISVIFIDPLSSYLGGGVDEYKNASVRAALRPLSKLAEKYNVAIICIMHLNKSETQKAINRVSGSVAYIAAARSAYIVLRDHDDRNNRLFLPIKNNIGSDESGFSFKIEQCELGGNITATKVAWSDLIITKKVDDILLSPQFGESGECARDDAKEFLVAILSAGKINVNDIFEQARIEKISVATLRRAKADLGVQVGRDGFGKGSKSFWFLPEKVSGVTIDDHDVDTCSH